MLKGLGQDYRGGAEFMKPAVIASLAVWGLWCAGQLKPAVTSWFNAINAALYVTEGMAPDLGGFVGFWLRQAVLPLLALVTAALALGAGLPLVRLLRMAPLGRRERGAVGVLFGFFMMGTLFMGLALLGLFTKPVMYACAGLPLVLHGLPRLRPRLSLRVTDGPPWKCWPILPALVPLGLTVLLMVLPDTNGDAYNYHLALSDRLFRTRRLTAEGTTIQLSCALAMEYVYSFAVGINRDELVHFINCVPFAAGLVLLLSWCARQGGIAAALIAAGGILSFGQVNQMMLVAKNDLAAAAFPVAGIVCAIRGLAGPSAGPIVSGVLLLGCGAAVKYSCLPLLLLGLAWIAASRFRARRGARGTALVLAVSMVPAMPWFMKSWLMMGDPVWPLLGKYMPGSLWDENCSMAAGMVLCQFQPCHSMLSMPVVLARMLIDQQPALAVLAPLVLVNLPALGTQASWATSYSLAGILLLWLILPLSDMRYTMPLIILIAACGAILVVRWTARLRPYARYALLAAGYASAWLPFGFLMNVCIKPSLVYHYLAGIVDREAYLEDRLTSYWTVRNRLVAMGAGGRMISIGDSRSYRLPVTLLSDRCYYRNWGWVFARESADARSVLRKMRQTGCTGVLYNFVFEIKPESGSGAFPWDDRMIGVWRDFVARYLELSPAVPRKADWYNGGYCVYLLRDKPASVPGKRLPYLPGLESLYDRVETSFHKRDFRGALDQALALDKRVPGVDVISNMVARGYAETGKWDLAHAYYRPSPEHGSPTAPVIWGGRIPMLWKTLSNDVNDNDGR